jgi:hypothetical protein
LPDTSYQLPVEKLELDGDENWKLELETRTGNWQLETGN